MADAGATVLISARDRQQAAAAARGLADAGDVCRVDVDLDVADERSVQAAAVALEQDPGRLDVLINKAAAYVDWNELASSADLAGAHAVLDVNLFGAHAVLDVNLFGAWRMIQALLPLLRHSDHPRIVNVSSGAGSHGDDQFGLTRRAGAAASYGISTAALGALTSTLAAELSDTPILVDAACPGLTATWPGAEQMGARPIPDGAASVVWAATLPDDGPSGGLFRDGQPLAW